MKLLASGKFRIRLIVLLAAFSTVYLCAWFYQDLFVRVDTALFDRMTKQVVPSDADGLPDESNLVFIDANFYYQRPEHALILRKLADLGVSSQLVDFIFHDKVGDEADVPLVQAVASANNVYFGMSFQFINGPMAQERDPRNQYEEPYLDLTQWRLNPGDSPEAYYLGSRPRVPFQELSSVYRGVGFLNLRTDTDGVLRRTPLLVRYQGAAYPSFAFRAVCDYLGVSPANIIVKPGKSITLKNAKMPASDGPGHDIVIPIDAHGNLLIKYTGVWNKIKNYSYSEIHEATKNANAFAKMKGELSQKIAILTEAVGAELKVPQAIGNGRLPEGVVHALVIQNILSEQFIKELPQSQMLLVELALLTAVFLLSLYLSPIGFFCAGVLVSGVYFGAGALLFLKSDLMVRFARPAAMVGAATLMIIIVMAVERAILFARTVKAKQLAERELEIGRQIQSGFFPSTLPDIRGWEVVSYFEAARHVAGDFYDAFPIGNHKRIGIVIADVCDKGVGAALYMALFRSLIRILSGAAEPDAKDEQQTALLDARQVLLNTIRTLNDYISVTHEKDGMFATLFFGILDPDTGNLDFINGGHEPPILISGNGIKAHLKPTGPAVGALPHLKFSVGKITFEPGDILFGYTDGVTDARNQAGEPFSKDRLMAIVSASPQSPSQLIAEVQTCVERFTQGKEQFDDITLIALGRRAEHPNS